MASQKHKIKTSDYTSQKNTYIDKGAERAQKIVKKSINKGVKKGKKAVNKLQKKRQKLSRDYMRLYNKLDMYGQAPTQPLEHPWQRDIERLKARWKTVNTYARYYAKLNSDIMAFNAEYKQSLRMIQPHEAINPRTYETLKAYGRSIRKEMRRVKKAVQNEFDLVENSIKELLQQAYTVAQPSHHKASGELSQYQQFVTHGINTFNEYYKNVMPSDPVQKLNTIQRIKANWDSFVHAVDTYLYNASDQEARAEAWALIQYYITGDPLSYTDVIDYEQGEIWEE